MSYSLAIFRSWFLMFVVALVFVVLMPHCAEGQTVTEPFLKRNLGFRRIDVMALEGGRTVVRIPKTDDAREVVVVGAIRIRVPLDVLVECFRDVETFFPGDGIVTQVGLFDAAPSVGDVQRLVLPEDDFKALRKCRVGKCKVKLTADRLEEISSLDRSRPDHERKVRDVMVRAFVRYLRDYISRGNAALPLYHDKSEPLGAGADFAALHSGSRQYLGHDDELFEYLALFPRLAHPDIEDIFYWVVEEFGLRPVTSVNHMMISWGAIGDIPVATVAVKQIYATHYTQGLVKLAMLMPASERYPHRGTYLVLTSRMRFDSRVGGIKRALLKRELEHTWAMHLKALQEKAEESYREVRVASRKDG